ncbi:MAG: thermonuclease family protein [Pseudomonadota bacterium]
MRGWRSSLLAAIVLSGTFVVFLIMTPGPKDNTTAEQADLEIVLEPLKEVRDVTPDKILKAPEIEEAALERLPALEPPPIPPKPEVPKNFQRPEIISTGILKVGALTIELADIDPIPLERICQTENGELWPCGRFARTQFRSFIRGRPIACEKQAEENGRIKTRCQLSTIDISAWLVRTGWATPSGDHFEKELEEAKQEHRGIWRKERP